MQTRTGFGNRQMQYTDSKACKWYDSTKSKQKIDAHPEAECVSWLGSIHVVGPVLEPNCGKICQKSNQHTKREYENCEDISHRFDVGPVQLWIAKASTRVFCTGHGAQSISNSRSGQRIMNSELRWIEVIHELNAFYWIRNESHWFEMNF